MNQIYLLERDFSLCGFFKFCKKNKILVSTTIFTLIMAYGIRLFNTTIGIDTDLHMSYLPFYNWLSIGRFGLVYLQKLWTIPFGGFNPFVATLLGELFLCMGTLVWCYVFYIFSASAAKQTSLTLFAIIFITHQTWVEQIYFVCQSAECMFIVLLQPISLFFLYSGILSKRKRNIVFGIFIATISISIYQSSIILFASGGFALFLLFKENTLLDSKEYTTLCVMLLTFTFIILVLYFALNKTVQFMLGMNISDYLTTQVGYEKSVMSPIVKIGLTAYTLLVGNIPFFQNIAEPIMASAAHGGWETAITVRGQSLMANILYTPALILFFILVIRNKKRSLLYIVAAICIPFCLFVLPMVGGKLTMIRTQFSIPLVSAFIFFYIAEHITEKITYTIICSVIALISIRQTFIASMLNYSDIRGYNYSVHMAADIANRIYAASENKDLPVLFYGAHYARDAFPTNYVIGEVIGRYPFEVTISQDNTDNTFRGTAFMRVHGYEFTPVEDEALIEKARTLAEFMPDYPANGSVKNAGDVIVVRFSETTYIP